MSSTPAVAGYSHKIVAMLYIGNGIVTPLFGGAEQKILVMPMSYRGDFIGWYGRNAN
jgi:hypothetical protein